MQVRREIKTVELSDNLVMHSNPPLSNITITYTDGFKEHTIANHPYIANYYWPYLSQTLQKAFKRFQKKIIDVNLPPLNMNEYHDILNKGYKIVINYEDYEYDYILGSSSTETKFMQPESIIQTYGEYLSTRSKVALYYDIIRYNINITPPIPSLLWRAESQELDKEILSGDLNSIRLRKLTINKSLFDVLTTRPYKKRLIDAVIEAPSQAIRNYFYKMIKQKYIDENLFADGKTLDELEGKNLLHWAVLLNYKDEELLHTNFFDLVTAKDKLYFKAQDYLAVCAHHYKRFAWMSEQDLEKYKIKPLENTGSAEEMIEQPSIQDDKTDLPVSHSSHQSSYLRQHSEDILKTAVAFVKMLYPADSIFNSGAITNKKQHLELRIAFDDIQDGQKGVRIFHYSEADCTNSDELANELITDIVMIEMDKKYKLYQQFKTPSPSPYTTQFSENLFHGHSGLNTFWDPATLTFDWDVFNQFVKRINGNTTENQPAKAAIMGLFGNMTGNMTGKKQIPFPDIIEKAMALRKSLPGLPAPSAAASACI